MSVREVVRKRRPKVVELELPGGDKVWIKSLSGEGRAHFRDIVEKSKVNSGLKSESVVAMALCESDGTLTYDFENPDDLKEIREMDGADVDLIFLRFLSVSGLNTESVEQLQKNSEATPNG